MLDEVKEVNWIAIITVSQTAIANPYLFIREKRTDDNNDRIFVVKSFSLLKGSDHSGFFIFAMCKMCFSD